MRAIFPGTFDPVTLAHQNIIQRAVALFGDLIIAVSSKHGKTVLLDIKQRVALLKQVCLDFSSVEVIPFDGMLIDLCQTRQVTCVVRGVRSGMDFEYESSMAQMNKMLFQPLETVLLPATPEYQHISSTLVREVVLSGGDVAPFVSDSVRMAIHQLR